MPPKSKITKERIVDAGFEIVRKYGAENMNARTIAHELSCSTQPVLYYFKTIDDIKKAVYQKADAYHTAYLFSGECFGEGFGEGSAEGSGKNSAESQDPSTADDAKNEIGLSYIRFAATEKHLFRFLFQSNEFSGKNMTDLIDSEELLPILAVLREGSDIGPEQAKNLFKLLFLFVHGYAGMFANNAMEYDEATISADLARAFFGAMCAVQEDLT